MDTGERAEGFGEEHGGWGLEETCVWLRVKEEMGEGPGIKLSAHLDFKRRHIMLTFTFTIG